MRKTCTALLIFVFCCGCGRTPAETEAPSKEFGSNEMPIVENPLIARINGRPITAAHFRDALEEQPASHDDALALAAGYALLEAEANRIGFDPGGTNGNSVGYRFLQASTSEDLVCPPLPLREQQEWFRRLQKRFIHPDVFDLVDVQCICCPRELAPCPRSTELLECIASCHEAFAALERDTLGTAARHVEIASLERALVAHPRLGVTDYKVAYDYQRSPEDQGGKWVILDPALRSALRDSSTGSWVGPVQTEYGVHLVWVQEHRAPRSLSLQDREVQEEITRESCAQKQSRMRTRILSDIVGNSHPVSEGTHSQSLWRNREPKGRPQ